MKVVNESMSQYRQINFRKAQRVMIYFIVFEFDTGEGKHF